MTDNHSMQKTIVFCATEDAAERMRVALVNLNKDMMKENPDYIVRITGSDVYGKSKLDYFISVSAKYPVIATTSELLSTGSDCKMTKLIVLDKNINSMTQFKQIIGRGTRVREDQGKLNFTVMDFRGVARLFADPDWDGPIEQDDDYQPGGAPGPVEPPEPPEPPGPKEPMPFVDAEGCPVSVVQQTVSVYDTNGKLRRHREEDAEVLYENFGKDPKMFEYSGWNPYATRKMAEETVRRFLASYEDPHFYGWAVEHDGRMIGTIGAYDFDPATRSIEVGCSIERDCWGKGFAGEALAAALDYLTKQEGIRTVRAWCAADNIGSRRIMEKAGMQLTSTEEGALEIDGKRYDKLNYELRV